MKTLGLAFAPLLPLAAPALTSALGLLAGCADDPDRPTYTIPAESSQRDTQVSDLSDPQVQEICTSYSSYVETEISFDAIAHAGCLVAAILSSFTSETCEEAYSACTDNAPSSLEVRAELEGLTACTQSLRSCDASVDQVEGCINVQLDALVDILDRLACGGDPAEMRDTAEAAMADLSGCANVDARCTDFAKPVALQ